MTESSLFPSGHGNGAISTIDLSVTALDASNFNPTPDVEIYPKAPIQRLRPHEA